MNNIYLVGMMGSGKTVTSKALASKLEKKCVDLDAVIEEKMGFSIADAFKEHGEDYFRDQEVVALKEVASQGNVVVATGGGVILRPENIDQMKATGKIIYLETEFVTLWNRVKTNTERPLLKGEAPQDKLEKILAEREGIYQAISHFSVKTDGLSAEQVAEDILKVLHEEN